MDGYRKLAVYVVGQACEDFRASRPVARPLYQYVPLTLGQVRKRLSAARFVYRRTDPVARLWFGLLGSRPLLEHNPDDHAWLTHLEAEEGRLKALTPAQAPHGKRSHRVESIALHPWVRQCYGE